MSKPFPEDRSGKNPIPVAPWGSPPTPLLPRWYRDNIPNVRLSAKIRAENPSVVTIGQLESFWDGNTAPLGYPAQRSLLFIANRYPPPASLVVIPAHVDRAELLARPLRARTANNLIRNGFLENSGKLSVADLLAIRDFGMSSLLELMCVAEAAPLVSSETPVPATASEGSRGPGPTTASEASEVPVPTTASSVPGEVLEPLEQLCRWASTEGDIKTLQELLDATRDPDRLPPDLARRWRGAVRACIATRAHFNPFSVILDWYRSLDTRRQVILSSRILALSAGRTLQDIASEFGVSRERIRQVEGGLIKNLKRLSRTKAWEPVLWRVHRVRLIAGTAFPWGDDATEALLAANQPCSQVEAGIVRGVILRLAGPYKLADGWLIADAQEIEAARLRLIEEAKDSGSVQFEAAREVMTAAGLQPRFFGAWLSHWSGMHEIRGSVIEWPRTLSGRMRSLMRLRGSPVSPDELLADLGPEVRMRSLKASLSSSEQFVRVGLSKWGLKAWRLPEYGGIAAAISEELSQNGPSVPVGELAARLSASWGIPENSVISLCNAPRFVAEHGMVRLRRDDEPFSVSSDLSQACGVFRPSDNTVSVLIDVDHDLLRGSGRTVAEQVAGLLALGPGEGREYEAGSGAISLYWPDTSISGPAMGSLRVHANDLNATVGDRLRITFRGDRRSADVRLVAKTRVEELDGDPLVTEITGLTGHGEELLGRLAAAVDSDTAGLARFLRQRGDTELAGHLPSPDASAALKAQIDRLARFLDP